MHAIAHTRKTLPPILQAIAQFLPLIRAKCSMCSRAATTNIMKKQISLNHFNKTRENLHRSFISAVELFIMFLASLLSPP